MSDGHFNRCILPHGQFQSGLNAGKSITKMKATEAFKRFITELHPEWDKEQMNKATDTFVNYMEEVKR